MDEPQMAKEMLINVSEGEECRIALVDDGRLEELYMERTSATSHVGNIYKGKVTNVEPSIQAAFVDFGLGRNGFLHISDLMPTYFGRRGEDIQESVGRKMARRDRPPIQRCLRRGDELNVQIIKEGIGTKGPTLSTYLSIPGRILVMMPGMDNFGVSRKIEDEDERRRLRGILDSLDPVEGVGFIIRTAGMGKTKAEIQKDLTYLTRLWQQIEKKVKEPAPVELYTEGDLVARTVRDIFSSDVDRLIVDNKDVAKRVKEIIKLSAPRTKNKVELYEDAVPLFHKYGIEREIEMMNSRHVPLPSGGSLVIDSTEAIVAIDVNSGKFREHADAETTAFKTDLEAADEIPRQLKLRDLGGVIICDFIDLRFERHRRELEHRLHENFKRDRAKTKVLRMSQFGIIELTRQRMRPSLKRSIYCDCPHCKGAGLVKTPESMSLDVMRRLAIAANDQRVGRVELAVCAEVNMYLQNKKRSQLADLEKGTGKRIVIRQDASLGLDEMKLELYDAREGRVYLDELGMVPEHLLEDRNGGRRGGRHDRGGRGHHPQQHGGGRGQQPQQHRPPAPQPPQRGHRDEDLEHDDDEHEGDLAETGADRGHRGGSGGGGDTRRPDDRARHGQQQPRRDQRQGGGGGGGGGGQQRQGGGPGQPGQQPQQQGQPQPGGEPGEGGGRRRRRRRRRRGRGGAGQQQPQFAGADNGVGGGSGAPMVEGGETYEPDVDLGPDEPVEAIPSAEADHRREDIVEASVEGLHEEDEHLSLTRDIDADEELGEAPQAIEDDEVETPADRSEASAEPAAEAEHPEPGNEHPDYVRGKRAEEGDARPRNRRGRGGRNRAGAAGRDRETARQEAEARREPPRPKNAPQVKQAPAEAPATDAAESPTPAAEGDAKSTGRRRRRRGGRGRAKGAAGETADADSDPAAEASAETAAVESPDPSMPAAPAETVAPPPVPVVKTGSTDKHHLIDEPVDPEPVRRPRSRRDLDAIPDDYD